MKILCVFILSSICGVCLGAGGGVSSVGSNAGGSFAETEETRLLRKGQPLSLTCTPNITVADTKWEKDGKIIIESDRIKLFPNTTLYITSANADDIGEYTCKHGSMLEPKTFNVVELSLQKHLPKSTTVLEDDKLSLTCQVDGNPHPVLQWLKDGEPVQESINSSRLILSENEAGVSNGSLLINPVLKSDSGNYLCLITQYSIQLNTTTEVRVKDIYAALWPFLGIVTEVIVLCVIIYLHERRRIKKNYNMSDNDKMLDQKIKDENKENEDTDSCESQPRELSGLELMKAMRDFKRRRQAYRTTVSTKNKSQTEVTRELIHNMMGLLGMEKQESDQPGSTSKSPAPLSHTDAGGGRRAGFTRSVSQTGSDSHHKRDTNNTRHQEQRRDTSEPESHSRIRSPRESRKYPKYDHSHHDDNRYKDEKKHRRKEEKLDVKYQSRIKDREPGREKRRESHCEYRDYEHRKMRRKEDYEDEGRHYRQESFSRQSEKRKRSESRKRRGSD